MTKEEKEQMTDEIGLISLELLGVADTLQSMTDNGDYNGNIVFMCNSVIERNQKAIQQIYENLIKGGC